MTVVNSRDAGAAGGVAAVEPRVRALARSCPQLRRRQCMALLLITPLFLFLVGTFILPLSGMLKPTMVFLLFAYLPVVLLTTFFPALSLTLPRLLLGG